MGQCSLFDMLDVPDSPEMFNRPLVDGGVLGFGVLVGGGGATDC